MKFPKTLNSLGKAGAVTFSSAEIAADYLTALPEGYSGKMIRGNSGCWIVSYRFQRALRLASRLNNNVEELKDIAGRLP